MLWQSKTIGCCKETSLRTSFPSSSGALSSIAASSTSSSLPSILRGKLFLAAKRLKKLVICWLVRNSSLLNSRFPSLSLAFLISLETTIASALHPVDSPILNFVVRYSFCLAVKRVLRVWDDLNAQPIERAGCSGIPLDTSWTICTMGTSMFCTSSLSA